MSEKAKRSELAREDRMVPTMYLSDAIGEFGIEHISNLTGYNPASLMACERKGEARQAIETICEMLLKRKQEQETNDMTLLFVKVPTINGVSRMVDIKNILELTYKAEVHDLGHI